MTAPIQPEAQPVETAPVAQPGTGTGTETELDPESLLNEIISLRQPAPEEGFSPEEEFRIKTETRFMISDIDEMLRDKYPNMTRAQRQKYTQAAVRGDEGARIEIISRAEKQKIESEGKADKATAKELHVEGASGTVATRKAERPKSLRDAKRQAIASILRR